MFTIETHRIQKYQMTDVSYSFLKEYFTDRNRADDILLLYNGDNLKTLMGVKDYQKIQNQRQLDFYLKSNINCSFNNNMESASEIFEKFPEYNYLIVSIGDESGKFICRKSVDIINDIYLLLKKKHVNVYRVKIPAKKDINNKNCYNEKCCGHMGEFWKFLISGLMPVPQDIDKFTDAEIRPGTKMNRMYNKQLGDSKRKIYIVGPCIVGGWIVPEKESLPEILFEKITDAAYEYSILPIQLTLYNNKAHDLAILEHRIKKNDIVIFINTYPGNDWEFDTTPLYNTYNGSKWLFTNKPIHATVTGHRIIADFLLDNIIRPVASQSNRADDNTVVYEGEPQFTFEMLEDIGKYIEKVRNTRTIDCASADVGAIVMNCNPFTYGHRHLVEYASGQVDYLYLFVVEEDLSAIPFSDRFLMVYEGVKDIGNVIVVPSGHFIISKDTFKNYFEKETSTRHVNAEEDVYIFARHIAKSLNISKRFVGEEPTDNVTNVYNQTMRNVFEKYGIELIEIPRKKLENGKWISATEVRRLLLKEEWIGISQYVPQSTLDYMKKIKDTVKQRIGNLSAPDNYYVQNKINEFVDMICHLDKIVIYSVGGNTKGLIKHLPKEVAERLEYCDKSAENMNFSFNGRMVEPPRQLLQKYIDYKIIVTSTAYADDIYEEFVEMGIEMDRCIFSPILFENL